MNRIAFRERVLIGLIILFGAQILQAQSNLEIIGTAENNMVPMPNAKVILYKDGKSIQTVYTDSRGEFKFNLDINSEYLIEIDKEGFYSKKIAFNTEVPSEIEGRWTMEFAMGLFPGCEGVDNSILNEPVDRIKYSTNREDFISDEAYVRNMRGQIERLMMDIDQCQSEKYQQAMQDGQNLLDQGKHAQAMAKFEEALKIYPNDRSASKKLAQAEEGMGESQQAQRDYQRAIEEADRLYAAKDLAGALQMYNEALNAKPDQYAQQKVNEINQTLQEQAQENQAKLQKDQQFNSLIAQGNRAYTDKNYAAAQSFYQQALQLKPNEAFPQQKINELGPLIAQQQQNREAEAAANKAYTEAIAMGQQALQANDFQTAKQHFSRAQMMKPGESYPQQLIAEADKKMAEQTKAKQAANEAAKQQQIERALDEGDALMDQNNFAAAQAAYERAFQLDPNDSYVSRQLNKAKSMQLQIEAEKQQALQRSFDASVAKGDELLAAGEYQQAMAAYKQAMLTKPGASEVQAKISRAEQQQAAQQQKLAAEESKKRDYDNLLAQANTLMQSKQYEEAKQKYQAAANLFPTQAVPRNKIQEIDQLLAQKQQEDQYQKLITRADNLLAAKSYDQAKAAYNQAVALNPSETYPKSKIAEIDRELQLIAQKAQQQQQLETQYNQTIREADEYFTQSKLNEAKAAYQRAQTLKSTETYPQQQIVKIDAQLAELQRQQAEVKAKDQQYASLIARADGLLAAQDYTQAKSAYQQALALKNTETYPQQKMAEIDGILQKQQQALAEQRMRDQQYQQLIEQADGLFNNNQFNDAKASYQRALTIKSGEAYPSGQIAKIDNQFAEMARKESERRAMEQQYNMAIAEGDKSLATNSFSEAKAAYQRALELKPGENYPTTQIAKVNTQLARIEKEKQDKAAFEQKYNTLISSADAAYNKRDYADAKTSYTSALEMKPGEAYPQQQLNKIAEFERILAVQKANQQTAQVTTTAAVKTASPNPKKLSELKFNNDSERDKYLKSLQKEYPEGVTLEVHQEKTKTTYRYVVIRGNEVKEFRKVRFNWGGTEFSDNGIPTTGQYFDSQVKVRSGEFYQEFNY